METNKNFFGEIDNVELKEYNKSYPGLFVKEIKIIQDILATKIIDCHHIGSTAIPNLISKPIIDIALSVDPFPLKQVEINRIENTGYKFWAENPDTDRMFFLKGLPRTHHLHIYPIGNQKLKNQILFRDMLIKNERLKLEYANLKTYLADRFFNDREKYTHEKVAFINKVLNNGKSWINFKGGD